ncbi:DUF4176 domain-containing protein [Listeria sp. FSL L7-1582]|uniref:DUF4176 domain-containing protein n=1 Tax=Listeria portnoyi TaxID=2713504 RepID=UPI00164EB913|nr:DUF4176 domain-containing protein [Listeria portnoyi]MBC6310735.1 DUF4176 domain-containing protein [Listeria portnoyi]
MEDRVLPLGTVVLLKDGDGSRLMIVCRASIVEDRKKEVFYDYGAVLIPQGMLSPEAVYFFNKENVEKVLFEGFKNEDENEFAEQYDEMVSQTKIPKGSI